MQVIAGTALTHAQLQTLLTMVRSKLTSLEEANRELKAITSFHYRCATPDSFKGMIAFSYLKCYLNMYRSNKKLRKQYSELAKSIKQSMKLI